MTDVAKQTPGFSGADLQNLINESALQQLEEIQKNYTSRLNEAIDRVSMDQQENLKSLAIKKDYSLRIMKQVMLLFLTLCLKGKVLEK